MKVGVIGLGDIARKAYLPVITGLDVDVHLYTRNQSTLRQVADQYRILNRHGSLESLIQSGVQAVFVHTATSAHEEIVSALLQNNIHVFVDKPVTDNYKSTAALYELAKKNNRILYCGFNRRFAPAYASLTQVQDINMIVMQKNRSHLPGDLRTFVFDDFIHVADTLLCLFPYPIVKKEITARIDNGKVSHVVIQLQDAKGRTAIGIMNRDSGTTEEKVEVFSSNEKRVVHGLTESIVLKEGIETKVSSPDWEPTLKKRGFVDMISDFLLAANKGECDGHMQASALASHHLCEEIVEKLS